MYYPPEMVQLLYQDRYEYADDSIVIHRGSFFISSFNDTGELMPTQDSTVNDIYISEIFVYNQEMVLKKIGMKYFIHTLFEFDMFQKTYVRGDGTVMRIFQPRT